MLGGVPHRYNDPRTGWSLHLRIAVHIYSRRHTVRTILNGWRMMLKGTVFYWVALYSVCFSMVRQPIGTLVVLLTTVCMHGSPPFQDQPHEYRNFNFLCMFLWFQCVNMSRKFDPSGILRVAIPCRCKFESLSFTGHAILPMRSDHQFWCWKISHMR